MPPQDPRRPPALEGLRVHADLEGLAEGEGGLLEPTGIPKVAREPLQRLGQLRPIACGTGRANDVAAERHGLAELPERMMAPGRPMQRDVGSPPFDRLRQSADIMGLHVLGDGLPVKTGLPKRMAEVLERDCELATVIGVTQDVDRAAPCRHRLGTLSPIRVHARDLREHGCRAPSLGPAGLAAHS